MAKQDTIQLDCPERVALDLAIIILDKSSEYKDKRQSKEEILTVYNQCYQAVIHGWAAEDILNK